MARRVFLHVATPKSGTTYLQAVLWQNTQVLREANLLLPGRFQMHYTAAKGVTNRKRMRDVKIDVGTAWPRLAHQSNAWGGDALVSHELFAPASAEQAEAAKAALDAPETHLILTARALHKQVPASWQQGVQGGNTLTFDLFAHHIRKGKGRAGWFWDVQDLPDIAQRWGAGIPAEQIHIVTVPQDASDPTLLWQRYASVLGVDPASCDVNIPKQNVSLGCVEAEVLRRINFQRDERFQSGNERSYARWTRRLLAVETLGSRQGAPFALSEDARKWISKRTADMERTIRDRGYHVVGDLADLDWQPPPESARQMSSVTNDEVDEVCAWTIARLQEELVQRQPDAAPPAVGPDDGIAGILELLEHIRAADTATQPRPGSFNSPPPSRRLRASVLAWRRH